MADVSDAELERQVRIGLRVIADEAEQLLAETTAVAGGTIGAFLDNLKAGLIRRGVDPAHADLLMRHYIGMMAEALESRRRDLH